MSTRLRDYVSTNCPGIDEILEGGISKGYLTLVYGEFKTGKTTFALQCATSAGRNNLKTLFLNCGNSFSSYRLAQIASDYIHQVASHILVFQLYSFKEQSLLIENLERYVLKDVALIVVDPITSLYRLELESPHQTFLLNRILNRQLAYLTQIAKMFHIAVLVTSQVHDLIQENEVVVEPVAMRVLRFWSQIILKLSVGRKPPVRRVKLEKHFHKPRVAECSFLLNETGIIDCV